MLGRRFIIYCPGDVCYGRSGALCGRFLVFGFRWVHHAVPGMDGLLENAAFLLGVPL
jgi:hypothetical protein